MSELILRKSYPAIAKTMLKYALGKIHKTDLRCYQDTHREAGEDI